MRLGAVIFAFVPRLVIAVPLFAVVVCAAICAALIDALSHSRAWHSPPIEADITKSCCERG